MYLQCNVVFESMLIIEGTYRPIYFNMGSSDCSRILRKFLLQFFSILYTFVFKIFFHRLAVAFL